MFIKNSFMKINSLYSLLLVLILSSCKTEIKTSIGVSSSDYLDSSQNDDQYLGGIKMIPISISFRILKIASG